MNELCQCLSRVWFIQFSALPGPVQQIGNISWLPWLNSSDFSVGRHLHLPLNGEHRHQKCPVSFESLPFKEAHECKIALHNQSVRQLSTALSKVLFNMLTKLPCNISSSMIRRGKILKLVPDPSEIAVYNCFSYRTCAGTKNSVRILLQVEKAPTILNRTASSRNRPTDLQ